MEYTVGNNANITNFLCFWKFRIRCFTCGGIPTRGKHSSWCINWLNELDIASIDRYNNLRIAKSLTLTSNISQMAGMTTQRLFNEIQPEVTFCNRIAKKAFNVNTVNTVNIAIFILSLNNWNGDLIWGSFSVLSLKFALNYTKLATKPYTE